VNQQIPAKQRAQKLYEVLMKERSQLQSQGDNTHPISQAIVDLIHTIGYHEPAVLKGLKNSDGLERLRAFRKILEERDIFAMELGYTNHFDQVLKDFHIHHPTGIASEKDLPKKIQSLEDETLLSGSERSVKIGKA